MDSNRISIIFEGLENECWQGKTDPQQRRRIQNRINQRTCRTKRRVLAGCSVSEIHDASIINEDDSLTSETSSTNNDPGQPSGLKPNPASFSTPFEGTMDELDLFINQNFRDTIRANLRSQGDDSEHLSKLQLNELSQGFTNPYSILAGIPHRRLRENVTEALCNGKLHGGSFCTALCRSGALVIWNGRRERHGMFVLGEAGRIESWEMSELFVEMFAEMLEGCEDFLGATNCWRRKRGLGGLEV